jgi:hypothetical protein
MVPNAPFLIFYVPFPIFFRHFLHVAPPWETPHLFLSTWLTGAFKLPMALCFAKAAISLGKHAKMPLFTFVTPYCHVFAPKKRCAVKYSAARLT